MFCCPLCHSPAKIRTSRPENKERTIVKRYFRCKNPLCNTHFTTIESFEMELKKHYERN